MALQGSPLQSLPSNSGAETNDVVFGVLRFLVKSCLRTCELYFIFNPQASLFCVLFYNLSYSSTQLGTQQKGVIKYGRKTIPTAQLTEEKLTGAKGVLLLHIW